VKINFFDVLDVNIESLNVWSQFLVSSVLMSLYAAIKVLSQIWGSPFRPSPSRVALPPALQATKRICDSKRFLWPWFSKNHESVTWQIQDHFISIVLGSKHSETCWLVWSATISYCFKNIGAIQADDWCSTCTVCSKK